MSQNRAMIAGTLAAVGSTKPSLSQVKRGISMGPFLADAFWVGTDDGSIRSPSNQHATI
jgi:hypothetical protein